MQYPSLTKAGHVDREHLVSNGLDLLPTLCDLAGVDAPEGLPGLSFGPLLGGGRSVEWREHLMIEAEFGWGIVDDRYKYTLYDAAGTEETLFDMRRDAGEMRNLASMSKYEGVLGKMRGILKEEARLHGLEIDVDRN